MGNIGFEPGEPLDTWGAIDMQEGKQKRIQKMKKEEEN